MPTDTSSPYGYCPQCGGLGRSRERRLHGNDRCENGHTYPSASAVKNPLAPPPPRLPVPLPTVNVYRVLSEAVERAVAYGYNRAHKHTDTPSAEAVKQHVYDAVMQELSEVFDFGNS